MKDIEIRKENVGIDNTGTHQSGLIKKLKHITIKHLKTTTVQGIPQIFEEEKYYLKIIWAFAFITSTAYMVYSVYLLISDYNSYPSYTSTFTVQEIPTKFPAITVCNMKVINKTKYCTNNLECILLNPSHNEARMSQYCPSSIHTWNESIRREFGYRIENMLVSCSFNFKNCTVEDFTHHYDPLRGMCYTFNKGIYNNGSSYILKTVNANGANTGLSLEFYIGDSILETQCELDDGMLISIHNQSLAPFTQDNELKCAAGSETDFIVTRIFISKLEKPYGNCLKDINSNSKFDSEIFRYIVQTLNVTYSQKYCFSLCQQRETMAICNCSNIELPIFKNGTKYCIPFHDCMVNVFANFNKTQSDRCAAECPYECDSVQYSVTSLSSLYPTPFYLKNVLKSKIRKHYKKKRDSFARINIYYDKMEYTSTIQSIAVTPQQLIGNIGGCLGLCIGISILWVVELLSMLIKLIQTLISYAKNC